MAIGLVLIGGLIGWAVASRSYGGGPIAGLQGQYSSADFSELTCAESNQFLADAWQDYQTRWGTSVLNRTGELRDAVMWYQDAVEANCNEGGPLLD